MIFDNERLLFSPHPLAPSFSADRDPRSLLVDLAKELSSQNPQFTTEVFSLVREAGFVSLWFYLKFILGHSGPYANLDDKLHLAMCNFRQRFATTPGIKAGSFIPRSCFKTTIDSHGGNSWELLRDPNIRIGCTSSIYDRALSFVQQTISNFEDNELHKALYPEWRKGNKSNDELIMSNRSRKYVEPSLQPITAGGSTQGIHVDLFNADDIVGDDMLTAEHAATADMVRMSNWLHTNLHTLVVSWRDSRVLVVGTRYSIDDPYERIMASTKEQLGWWNDSEYQVDPKGEWVTFYIPAIVEGESINPAAFTVEQLHRMAEDDPWTYQSQYMNNARASGAADFADYTVHDCELEWSEADKGYVIYTNDGNFEEEKILLKDCDVVAAGDPAASTQKAGTRTSRGSACVIARDALDRVFVLEAEAGFVPSTKWFDWLFGFKKRYGEVQRLTVIEAQGGFKALVPILQKEQNLRNEYLNLLTIPALGNKETTIRNILQPVLNRGKLFVKKSIRGRLMEELRSFPSSKMDLLDALKIAIYKSVKPDSPDDDFDDDDDDEGSPRLHHKRARVNRTSGY